MPVRATSTRRPEAWLRRIASEFYLGMLVVTLTLAVVIGVVAGVSYLMGFVNWVALND